MVLYLQKSHMRDLEDRVADMRAELNRERAHQARSRKLVDTFDLPVGCSVALPVCHSAS